MFRRQEDRGERTPEQRAHDRAVREARRRGLPDPPRAVAEAEREEPPQPEPEREDSPPQNPVAHPPGEPVVGDAPEPVPEPPDERTRIDVTPPPTPEPEPEPGEITATRRPTAPAGRSWLDEPPSTAAAATDAGLSRSWLDEPESEERPHPEPEDPDPPHGDPLVPPHREPGPEPEGPPVSEPDDPDPPHGDPLRAIRGLDLPVRAPAEGTGDLRRDLPPLPAETASRQPPRAPRRPRGGAPGAPPSRPPGEPKTGRRRRRWRARVGAVAAIALAAAAILFLIALFQPFHGDGHGKVVVTIPKGASANDIGDLLAQKGVVAHGSLFALRAALAGKRGDFQAGGYTLQKDMAYGDAIDVLTGKPGAAATINVTIPEGRGRRETAPLLKQAGVTGNYLAASRSSGELDPRAYGAPKSTPSLEGFLFPATYNLKRETATADRLVTAQLRSFKENFGKVDLREARKKNLSRYDVIKIASMIDREAQVARDRRLVSAVIYNRLKRDMPLGIDATTRYALNDWDRPLSNADFARSGRFNTRRHSSLPPTPIGNPGLAALQAAANPAHVSYLYYVIKPCAHGAHAFSSTDARFQRDVSAYNAARKRLGHSPVNC